MKMPAVVSFATTKTSMKSAYCQEMNFALVIQVDREFFQANLSINIKHYRAYDIKDNLQH